MGMAPFVRKEMIERADELVRFARTVFDGKRAELLRKASNIYKEATLGQMSELTSKEADEWEAMSDDIWRK
jgi:hypothetical protein